ncbi:putative ABC transport system permease protein [Actinoplanes lutulentus]|uniref:Putative ABC transport system permease protein n=1 Tax=Actinoplanes lutulentus TaxID=1287878 RepID=A0A327Z2W8_9ACTN|nr:FtsX-like permease family protein [Actinoplanes lutulentus]MBB2943759.1 putative ABC transport system permease protein [Actinoplanes lutulentus]RAK29301.1 putative ABC transport system permease protein [Actinoplanes lutulentus]
MIMQRVRAFAGQLGLLAALVGLAAFLSAGPGRLANGTTDEGLRADIGALMSSSRDLTFTLARDFGSVAAEDRASQLDPIREQLPAPLPGLLTQSWFVTEIGPVDATVGGEYLRACPSLVGIRRQTGSDQATRIVEGRAPRSAGSNAEAMIGTDEAKALGLKVGDAVTLHARVDDATVRIVGRYEPVDATAPFWADQKLARVACPSILEDTRYRATLLTDPIGAQVTAEKAGEFKQRWRYRLDDQLLTADQVTGLTTAVAEARRRPPVQTALQSGVDTTLADFDKQLRAVQAVLAVVQAGILATVAGLILLAARLAADRRRTEYALIRARGGSVAAIAGRAAAEAALVVLPAAAIGWLAGALVPSLLISGRPDPEEPLLVLGFTLLALLSPAALAAAAAHRPDFTGHRQDLAGSKPSPRRITGELFLIALAAGGAYLVRRRGIDAGAGVDPYLIAVPVLLSVAASLIALRLVPFPLRAAGRLTARARGAIAFLGLAGAGRGAPMRSWPLSVLVVAIATGIFAGTVATTVGHGRDRAADLAVPADAVVTGFSFAVDTPARIAEIDGVTRATPLLLASAAEVRSDSSPLISQIQAMVVDAATSGLDLPAELVNAGPSEVVPAVASPKVAERIGAGGKIDIQGRRYVFRVAAVRDTVPGLGTGVREFLVLPSQAMLIPDFQPLVPNRILVDGDGWDPAAVRRVADDGQRAQTLKSTGKAVEDFELNMPATVMTRAAYRESLDERGVDGVLSFTFAAGLVASAALALLAVALTVLAGAPARGRTLSRLRTLGLSTGQGRGLLVFELVPLLGVAVLAGALTGAALPALIAPALGLDDFTAGVPAEISADPYLAAGVLVVTVLAVIAALVVEDIANRRLRLGTVLRLGEEQS